MSDLVMAGPCCICGATNYGLSYGGPSICSACDCGDFGQARIARQGKELLAAIARAEAAEKLVGEYERQLSIAANRFGGTADTLKGRDGETPLVRVLYGYEMDIRSAFTRARQSGEADG